MAAKGLHAVSILDKSRITTKDIILYLELIDHSNIQILKVLMKKPTLPEYEKLPWVVNVRLDMFITKKLRSRTSLNSDESARLKSTLAEAAKNLKKLHGPETKTQINGLENYIQSL